MKCVWMAFEQSPTRLLLRIIPVSNTIMLPGWIKSLNLPLNIALSSSLSSSSSSVTIKEDDPLMDPLKDDTEATGIDHSRLQPIVLIFWLCIM